LGPNLGNSTSDSDCNAWSNGQRALCYDCQPCKAGMRANLNNGWKKISTIMAGHIPQRRLLCWVLRFQEQ
uniref:Uncharacterized protein n=1 Tax=Aegilops tauschii subsp. strangulata TaxID=200361 RepID=A0A453J4A9_AEGTS